MDHMLASTLICNKPTFSYSQLCTILAHAATIMNEQPAGIWSLTEVEIVPLIVNQLLLGRNKTANCGASEKPMEDKYVAANNYHDELLT